MKDENKTKRLSKIGTKVLIDLNQINDTLPENIYTQIKNDPIAIILDYKMTDSNGIGVIVELVNGNKTWLFDHEIKEIGEDRLIEKNTHNNKVFIHKQLLKPKNKNTKSNRFSRSKDISYLINPMTFIRWIIYSTKDIT